MRVQVTVTLNINRQDGEPVTKEQMEETLENLDYTFTSNTEGLNIDYHTLLWDL